MHYDKEMRSGTISMPVCMRWIDGCSTV